MVATAIYSVTMVLWKETAFPLCRAMERRWRYYYYYYYILVYITCIACAAAMRPLSK